MKNFPNLAGNPDADAIKLQEMTQAGIFPVYHNLKLKHSEVPGHYTGEVYIRGGLAIFTRAWGYWSVNADVPLSIAREIYDEARHLNIRAAGHCENPNPDDWAEPQIDELKFIFREHPDILNDKRIKDGSFRYIKNYHIDTQEGLKFFVDKVAIHND